MKARIFLVALTAMFSAALFSCSNGTGPGESRELTTLEKQVVGAANDFGLEFFQVVAAEDANENLFVSPFSVSMALGMTLNGASGQTKDDMEAVLGFTGMSNDEINQSYKGLSELLTKLDPKVQFNVANSIWYRQNFNVESLFIQQNKDFFDAQVEEIDFSNAANSAKQINNWVKEKTKGKIEDLVKEDGIDSNTIMFLINAIYFKGDWTYKFDKKNTRKAMFRAANGGEFEVDMMNATETHFYQKTEGFQAIDLPYGDAGFRMMAILPKEGEDINAFITSLDAAEWQSMLNSFREQEVELAMPKFKLEYEIQLNDVLKTMGMGIAFSDNADFSRISAGSRLKIDEVKHKTFVEVNEEGTEAAAATSVEIVETSIPVIPRMTLDRPFVFIIHDMHSESIVFAGRMMNPATE